MHFCTLKISIIGFFLEGTASSLIYYRNAETLINSEVVDLVVLNKFGSKMLLFSKVPIR